MVLLITSLRMVHEAPILATQIPEAHRAPAWVSLLFLLLMVGAWALSLLAVTRYSEDEYRTVGASKSRWLVVAWVLGGLGGLVWLLTMRDRLKANRRSRL